MIWPRGWPATTARCLASELRTGIRERMSWPSAGGWVSGLGYRGPSGAGGRSGRGAYGILGAGLDSFAYRRGDLLDRVRVFEVTHPASQAWKRQRLSELAIKIRTTSCSHRWTSSTKPCAKALRTPGSSSSVSVLVVDRRHDVPGLDAIKRRSRQIHNVYRAARSRLSTTSPTMRWMVRRQVTNAFSAIAAEMGEPFVNLFLPHEIEELLRGHGSTTSCNSGHQRPARIFNGRGDIENRRSPAFGSSHRGPAARAASAPVPCRITKAAGGRPACAPGSTGRAHSHVDNESSSPTRQASGSTRWSHSLCAVGRGRTAEVRVGAVRSAPTAQAALSGEVGVAIEMLLTTAEQVRTTGRAPPDYACRASVATARDVIGPSQMEQSTAVGCGCS